MRSLLQIFVITAFAIIGMGLPVWLLPERADSTSLPFITLYLVLLFAGAIAVRRMDDWAAADRS